MSMVLKAWNRIFGGEQNVHSTGNALHVLDEEDAAIHQGEAFHLGKKMVLAPGAVAMLSGTVGAERRVHFQDFSLGATTGPIEVDFYKGTVVQSGTGSAEAPINRRLDISSSSQMAVRSGVTLTTTGTIIVPTANFASPSLGGREAGGREGFFHGFVLDLNKTYAIGLKNTSVDTATCYANFAFNEPQFL